MKRKFLVISIVLILATFVTGMALAANPIKIIVNGREVKSDVAPFTKNGRTMVPIRLVSEALGANVEWNEDFQTVYINQQNSREKDIYMLKLYSRIAGQYESLEILGMGIKELSPELSGVFDQVQFLNDVTLLDVVNKHANACTELYNSLLITIKPLYEEALKSGLDISDMYTMLGNYCQALDYYKLSSQSLRNYYYSRSNYDFKKYIDNRSTMWDITNNEIMPAQKKYFEYCDKVQNY